MLTTEERHHSNTNDLQVRYFVDDNIAGQDISLSVLQDPGWSAAISAPFGLNKFQHIQKVAIGTRRP
jgi:hypothetical protein